MLTGIHWKNFVVAEELASVLLELAENGVVEGSRGERHLCGLFVKGLENSRMTVTLVDSAVSAQEVIVAFTVHVPHEDTWKMRERERPEPPLETVPVNAA